MVNKQLHRLPEALPGFEHINRYWDRVNDIPAAKILPGEYYVTTSNEVVTTVLGSCISACIRDRYFGVGGMNHFMLPLSEGGHWAGGDVDLTSMATRYGNFAMEHMINDILSHGGHKKNLEVKIFGGGQIIHSMTNVGLDNIEFVREYLHTEGLQIASENVGDIYPRKIVYYPATGRVRLKKLKDLHNDTVVQREQAYQQDIVHEPVTGDVELF